MSANPAQQRLVRTVRARRDNLGLRLGSPLVIALILHLIGDMAWVWIWAAAYGAILLAELWLSQPLIRQPEVAPSRWRQGAIVASPFMTSLVFGALSMPLFASEERFAPTLGGMLLAGSLLNVIVVNCSLRSATLAAGAPYVFYLLAAPVVARLTNPDAPLATALWFGALLLVTAVAVTARTLEQALRSEGEAKEEAERRRYEAEEAVAAKSAFVAMISHELRTPISAILAGADRLQQDAPDASARNHAQLIGDAGGMMRTLLNDLLDFSRLEAGRMAVESAPFDLRRTVSDTLRLWRPDAAKKGLKLRVEGAAVLPRWVAGDSMRLRQVLNNLLSNAIKFTERGAVTLRLSAESRDGGWRLDMTVVDTGPGIPQDLIGRLFQPFDQLSAAVVRRHGGSGLGLGISRDLARLMGGDLTATSIRGEGSDFVLTLVVAAAEAPTDRAPRAAIDGARVLVVDDHVVNRRAIELVLEPFGIRPTLAESGERALELLGTELFDVVLMDVYMPGLDGRDATRALRSGQGPNAAIPVIAITASATDKDWDACQAAGMNAHVAKPIEPAELYAALSTVLAGEGDRVAA